MAAEGLLTARGLNTVFSSQHPIASHASGFWYYITWMIVSLGGYFWSSLAAGTSASRVAKFLVD
jgi:hypothetical protein